MNKKKLLTFIILPLVVILAACSSLNIPGLGAITGQNNQSAQNAQNGQNGQNRANNFDPSKMPVEAKLGIGILKLEDTPNAVTPQQAKDLLPLWKAVKSLSTSNTTSTDEMNALYKQIQDTLTPAQVQAIQTMTWQQSDLRDLSQKYGVQMGGGGQGGFANLTPEQRATRIAQFQAQGGGGAGGNRANGGAGGAGGTGGNRAGGGGFVAGGGGFPGGGNFGQGGGQGQNGQANAQRTPQPGQAFRRGANSFNIVFADAVIKVLQAKGGA